MIAGKWRTSEHLVAFGAALIGSMLLYHLLTSVRRCAQCAAWVFNFGIGPSDQRGKRFNCPQCGGQMSSREGFVWQRDFGG